MRAVLIIAALAALAGEARAAELGPPIALAAKGMMQCYAPDATRKTCQSLAGYSRNAKGGIDNLAIVLISGDPKVVMRTVSPVTIKDGQVCGPLRAQDIAASTFMIKDAPATPAQTAGLRQQMQAAMKDVLGREICTAYPPGPTTLMAKETIDGVPQPNADQPVIWVAPTEGYKVAP